MHRLITLLLLLVLTTPVAAGTSWQQPAPSLQAIDCTTSLAFGDTVLCALTVAGELDSFTFTANAGDRVLVRMATAGNLQPRIRVLTPGATVTCQAQSYGDTADTDACALATTGTYTIEASSIGNETGNYGLSLQRLNAPVSASTLAPGQSLTAALVAMSEIDTYTLSAAAGDALAIRMASTTSGLDPYLRLYGSDGIKRCEAYSYAPIAEPTSCVAPASDTYTLVLTSLNSAATGTYGVALQRLNAPAGAPALPIGTPLSATLATPAELDAYTFGATANQTVVLRMASSGSLNPQVRIYRPGGVLQCSNYSYGSIAEVVCLLPSTGDYTVLASAFDEPVSSGYALSLQRIQMPIAALPLTPGVTATGTLTMPGQLATYHFVGQLNEAVYLRMGAVGSNVQPELRVFADDGALVCGVSTYGQATDLGPCLLPRYGSYTVLASAFVEPDVGGYAITMQRLGQPERSQTLYFRRDQYGELPSSASLGTHTFTAAGSSSVRLRLTDTGNSFNPVIQIFSADGTRLCSQSSYTAIAEITTCVLPSNGVYTVLVSSIDDSIGRYRLTLTCMTGSCGALTPPDVLLWLPLVQR